MKAFFNAVKRSPKLTALTAALVGAVVVPAALFAWGPSNRPTFTMANPADHVVFNSITDNPDMGDERNFVRIREAGVGNYGDVVNVQPGKEYEVEVFYHNNAATIYNDAQYNYAGIAQNVTARVEMPAEAKAGQQVHITGYVSASNATPQSVWDEAYLTSNQDVALRYVDGSAKVHTKGAINGQAVSNSLYTTGALLGFNAFDGKVPGCNDFEGWVVFRVKAAAPDFQITKEVSKDGGKTYSKDVTVNAGDTVNYRIQYKNTGSVNQENVVVKDQLPAGLSYVPGTSYLYNAVTNGQWSKVSDNVVTANGINIGTYAPNGNAYVSFKAKVTDADKLPKCGVNTLVNTATVETDNGGKSDTANIEVNKICKNVPNELPKTGIDNGLLSALGLGTLTAGIAYAVRSTRIRSLLRG